MREGEGERVEREGDSVRKRGKVEHAIINTAAINLVTKPNHRSMNSAIDYQRNKKN